LEKTLVIPGGKKRRVEWGGGRLVEHKKWKTDRMKRGRKNYQMKKPKFLKWRCQGEKGVKKKNERAK